MLVAAGAGTDPDSVTELDEVTFTATVSNTGGTGASPIGSVDFQDATGGADLGTVSLTGGSASIVVSSLSLGNHTIVATFTPDPTSNFAGSQGSMIESIDAATTTRVSATPVPGVFGQPVTFAAVVGNQYGIGGTPAGSVQFQVDGSDYGQPVALDQGGQASISDQSLGLGRHTIIAAYEPTGSFGVSQGTVPESVDIADSWTGAAGNGNWDTPGNWSYGVPQLGYDVNLGNLPANTVIALGAAEVVNNVTVSSPLTVSGGKLTVGGTLTASALLTLLNGATLSAPNPFTLQAVAIQSGSTLSGRGTVDGNLLNNGELDMGSIVGRIMIEGNYTQGSAGTLTVKIAGAIPNEMDVLDVLGTTTLAGTLNTELIDGFIPQASAGLQIVESAIPPTGSFTRLDSPVLNGTLDIEPVFAANGVIELWTPPGASASGAYPGVPKWQSEGPADLVSGNFNASGAIESIVVSNNGYVYVGTVNGGVWDTSTIVRPHGTDPGMFTSSPTTDPNTISWTALTDSQPSLAVASMALDPAAIDPTGNTLWVGTGSLSSGSFNGEDAVGILKTTNGGATWSLLGQDLAGKSIVAVVPTSDYYYDPTTGALVGQVILAATLDGGVYRSVDGGKTFALASNVTLPGAPQLLAGTATDLVRDPANVDRFYAALAYNGTQGGVYESDDDGATWVDISGNSDQLYNAAGLKLATSYDGRDLYAVPEHAGNVTGAWVTNAVGGYTATNPPTWNAIGPEDVPKTNGAPSYQVDLDAGHFAVLADPSDAAVIYLGGYATSTIYRIDRDANDGVGSWTPLDGTNLHSDQCGTGFSQSRFPDAGAAGRQ